MNKSILERIKQTQIEDIIWIIYFFIVIAHLYSNYLQRDYINNRNKESKRIYRSINKYVLIIAFIIYLYFVYSSYNSLKDLTEESSDKSVFLTHLTLISSILFLVAGAINIFIENNRGNDDEVGLI